MKAATVILLLAALVCSAICDPDRPDDKQTAEPEGYGYGGRSRGNNYDNDDSYGYKDSSNYKDGYATKRRAPMPRVYPDDDDYYPSKQTCLCSTTLGASTLNTANNCAASCTSTGGYCDTAGLRAAPLSCPCVTTATADYGSSTSFAACKGDYSTGGGGLCLQFTCPIDGTINIQGQAVPITCGGCATSDFLYIYKSSAFTANSADILANNLQSADVTVECKKNDTFFVCEKNGIIVTSSVKATFFAQSSGACTTLGTSNTWTTRQCRN